MLQKISNLKGAKVLTKKDQKNACGGIDQTIDQTIEASHPCGETGGKPISNTQYNCYYWGVKWYNGQCYACY